MKRFIFLTLLIAIVVALAPRPARADAPYTTWTRGPLGGRVMSQEAYTPVSEIDLPVSGPEELFITPEGVIYVADTGNGRIVKLDDNFEVESSYGEDVLEGPTGLFVDDEGVMYVADAGLNAIVILGPDGEVINQFGRPTEPLFGRNREFLPRKIAVDARENLYIISEGSVNGLVQMNTQGNFIGYYGANSASMSLTMILRRMFLTEQQLEQFIRNEAASPTNLTIDPQSLVFTITSGTSRSQAIRRFTIAGRNIFPDTLGSTDFRDIHVSEDGLVVAVAGDGQIYEYDLNGTPLFIFGALDTGEQRLGTLRSPTAIARHEGNLYVLDRDRNSLVVYQTTAFAQQVHAGVRLYMGGFYDEAKPFFEDVLDYNGLFIMAYQAVADAYFKEMDYENALAYYRLAEDRDGYSQAYWELRNQVLQRHLSNALMVVFGMVLVSRVASTADRHYAWSQPIHGWADRLKSIKLVDDFLFMFRFIKQPIDSFYYIKKDLRGSLRFALLIYGAVVVIRVLELYVTGFVFNPAISYAEFLVPSTIASTLLLIVLWNSANYLISTISDGEGRIRHVVIGTAYSLFPYLLIALPVALISNVLTQNELFLYSFPLSLMWLWIGIMLFIMVREIHNYSISETVKNILVTVFTMALFVLTGYILYVLFDQLFEFVKAVAQELRLRA
jgi:DNA-binding beta-propeller fold protein YncE